MLKLSNITKRYTLGGSTIDALRGVDLEFRENEFVSILGPSGCGKTTTPSSTAAPPRTTGTPTGTPTATTPSASCSRATT